jgi:hypothetical protein
MDCFILELEFEYQFYSSVTRAGLTTYCANNRSNGLKSGNERGDSREDAFSNRKSLLYERNNFLSQKILLIRRASGGKGEGSVHIVKE